MQGLSKTLSVVVDSDGVGDLTGDMGRAASSVSGLQMAVAGAGAALAALSAGGMAKAISAASDFESKMAEVQKVTSEAFAEEFQSDILEMSKNIPLAASELATLTEQAGRFGVAEENIRSFVETTAKMAEATDVSVEKAGEAFAKLATLTDTPIPKMKNLGSAINTLSNNFATSSQEIVDSMLRSAGALSQLGMSQTDIAGLSAAINAVSESSERAGTRMRRLAQEMIDPAKVGALGQALGVTGEEFKRMVKNDPTAVIMEMARVMKEGGESADILNRNLSTTSRQALSGLGSNLDQVNKALDTSNESFKKGTSLQEEFQIAVQTTENQFKLLKNELAAVAIQTGQVLLPAVKKLIGGLRGLVQRFAALNKRTNGTAGALALITGVVGGLTTAFIALSPQIMAVAGGIAGSLVPALSALLGPIGLVIVAVGALGAAFATDFGGIRTQTMALLSLLRDKFAPIVQRVMALGQQVVADFQAAWATHGPAIEARVRTIAGLIELNLVPVINTLAAISKRVLARISAFWDQHGAAITSAIMGGIVTALDLYIAYAKTVRRLVQGALAELTRLWKIHGKEIWAEVLETWEAIKPYVKTALDTIMAAITWFTNAASAFWKQYGDEILTYTRYVWDGITSLIGAALDIILTTIRVFLNVLQGDWGEAWTAIKGLTERLLTGIERFAKDWGGRFLSWLKGVFSDAASWVKTTAKSLWTSAVDAVLGAVKGAFEAFARWLFGNSLIKDLFGDIANWLKTTAKEAIGGAAQDIVGAIESAFNAIDTSGITNAIDDIISLANRAIDRIKGIPKQKDVTVTYHENYEGGEGKGGNPDTSGSSSSGGSSTTRRRSTQTSGGAAMQSGGIVNAGSGMRAILHGREAVVPLDRIKPLLSDALLSAAGAQGGGGGGLTVVVQGNEFNGVADGEDAADIIADGVTTRLRRR